MDRVGASGTFGVFLVPKFAMPALTSAVAASNGLDVVAETSTETAE